MPHLALEKEPNAMNKSFYSCSIATFENGPGCIEDAILECLAKLQVLIGRLKAGLDKVFVNFV